MTQVTAALLIIGDEILSGRTEDKNASYIARFLNEVGIILTEVRIIPDIADTIAENVNHLRGQYDYLFTTGGIGPTHDDITAPSIAQAFDVPLTIHPKAYETLLNYYGQENFTPARQRMARTPEGASLINNPVSLAPGFQLDNVFTLAGVPKIMQAMLEDVRPRLKGGTTITALDITLNVGESLIADYLASLQKENPTVSIGSYPFYGENRHGVQIVIRSSDPKAAETALQDLHNFAENQGIRMSDKN